MKNYIKLFVFLPLFATSIAVAQQKPESTNPRVQTTGTPGSPSYKTTISGAALPAPETKFGGVIKQKV